MAKGCDVGNRLPDHRQHQAGDQRTDPAGVEVHGHRVFGARHLAGEDLEPGVGEHHHQGQQAGPADHVATGLHHQQRAGKAAHHQQPAQRRHALAQEQGRQQRDHQRRDHDDGGELAHRHVLQGDEGQRAHRQQQRAAQQLESRVLGAHQAAAAHRQHDGGDEHRMEHVAEPHGHQHRHEGADVLHRGVEHREAGRGQDQETDAQRGLRGRVARRLRHHCRMRDCSKAHTGVTLPGRSGNWPRSVWLSSGLWKSLPRDAARPNSWQNPAYLT